MESPILIGSDGTSGSAGAIGVGAAIAKSKGTPVEVLTVQEPMPPFGFVELVAIPDGHPLLQTHQAEQLRNAVRRQVDELIANSDSPIEVKIGPAALTIVERAREIGASLIVLGAGPHFAMDRWLRSETGLKVVRLAHVPVLLVPERVRDLPRSALVAVDFSPFSLAAVKAAASLIPPGGRLHLTHVIWSPVDNEDLPSLDEYWRTYKAGAVARLDGLVAEIRAAHDLTVEASVICGDPSREILALADRLGDDVIAAGSHGYGYLSRVIMGSVSTRLIRGARGMVLIVPPVSVPAELEKHFTADGSAVEAAVRTAV